LPPANQTWSIKQHDKSPHRVLENPSTNQIITSLHGKFLYKRCTFNC